MTADSWDLPGGRTQSACECPAPGQCLNAGTEWVEDLLNAHLYCTGCWRARLAGCPCEPHALPVPTPRERPTWMLLYPMLAQRVTAKRRERGVSQRTAAHEAGVSPPTIGRIEQGAVTDDMHVGTFLALCSWLNQPPDVFQQIFHTGVHAVDWSPMDGVEAIICADTRLSIENKALMCGTVRALYAALSEGDG